MADVAARMDAIYRTQRHVYDLTRKYYLLGRDQLLRDLALETGGRVLEIGCGTARNLIVAARLWPRAHLFGLDISHEMLATAERSVRSARVGDRISLARADAARFDGAALFGSATFDRVIMSYTLSMIPDWWGALKTGAEAIGPGGRLEIVDFGQQEGLPGPFRAGLHAWLRRFDVTPRAALREAAEAVSVEQGLRLHASAPYRGYAWRISLVRDPARPAGA